MKKINMLWVVGLLFLSMTLVVMAKVEYPQYCHVEGNNRICCTKDICSIEPLPIEYNDTIVEPPIVNNNIRHSHRNSNFMSSDKEVCYKIDGAIKWNCSFMGKTYSKYSDEFIELFPKEYKEEMENEVKLRIDLNKDSGFLTYMLEHSSQFD
jgi:hypothetical protein